MAIPFTKNARLLEAVKKNDLDGVKKWLEKGASPDTYGDAKGYVLEIALKKNYAEIAAILLKAGANEHTALGSEWTALTQTIAGGKYDCVEALIDAGQDLNKKNAYGDTPLHVSLKWGYISITKLLAQKGARTDIPDMQGVTAMELALQKHMDINQLFFTSVAPAPPVPPAMINSAAPKTDDTDQWTLLSPERVVHVMDDKILDRKIADTFNFSARERLLTIKDLSSGQTQVILKSFDEITDKTPVEQAWQELRRLGGTAEESLITASPRKLKSLKDPGMGG